MPAPTQRPAVSLVPTTQLSGGRVTITRGDIPLATSYEWRVRTLVGSTTNSFTAWMPFPDGNVLETIVPTGLATGNRAQYQVRGVNSDGNGPNQFNRTVTVSQHARGSLDVGSQTIGSNASSVTFTLSGLPAGRHVRVFDRTRNQTAGSQPTVSTAGYLTGSTQGFVTGFNANNSVVSAEGTWTFTMTVGLPPTGVTYTRYEIQSSPTGIAGSAGGWGLVRRESNTNDALTFSVARSTAAVVPLSGAGGFVFDTNGTTSVLSPNTRYLNRLTPETLLSGVTSHTFSIDATDLDSSNCVVIVTGFNPNTRLATAFNGSAGITVTPTGGQTTISATVFVARF